jgi:hypothetical protein
MYSLTLIIFVVSEKAFEHFPIGSNVNLWKVLYKASVFYADRKSKMVAIAGLSLTLDPMGKMFQNASSLKPPLNRNESGRQKLCRGPSNDPSWAVWFQLSNKGNNKITELRTILQRENQNS